VPLKFRTAQRVMIVNVPGEAPLIFKLRLAASPSHSTEFSPWHLVDQVSASARAGKTARTNDGYAIRYRVI
jgi:hypothetical protein